MQAPPAERCIEITPPRPNGAIPQKKNGPEGPFFRDARRGAFLRQVVFRRREKPRPTRPTPRSASVAGSGTCCCVIALVIVRCVIVNVYCVSASNAIELVADEPPLHVTAACGSLNEAPLFWFMLHVS